MIEMMRLAVLGLATFGAISLGFTAYAIGDYLPADITLTGYEVRPNGTVAVLMFDVSVENGPERAPAYSMFYVIHYRSDEVSREYVYSSQPSGMSDVCDPSVSILKHDGTGEGTLCFVVPTGVDVMGFSMRKAQYGGWQVNLVAVSPYDCQDIPIESHACSGTWDLNQQSTESSRDEQIAELFDAWQTFESNLSETDTITPEQLGVMRQLINLLFEWLMEG